MPEVKFRVKPDAPVYLSPDDIANWFLDINPEFEEVRYTCHFSLIRYLKTGQVTSSPSGEKAVKMFQVGWERYFEKVE